MDRRLKLDQELKLFMGKDVRVYFQPPPTYKIKYPCLIYELSSGTSTFAGNMPYTFTKRYSLTLITRDPDMPIVKDLAMAFPMIVMDRAYTADNLYHYAYTLYY